MVGQARGPLVPKGQLVTDRAALAHGVGLPDGNVPPAAKGPETGMEGPHKLGSGWLQLRLGLARPTTAHDVLAMADKGGGNAWLPMAAVGANDKTGPRLRLSSDQEREWRWCAG